ncbi:hypothetical protein VTK26DRAFT_5466 [Humicola hyalothermophila]
MPPPNTPEEGVTAPTSNSVSASVLRSTSPHPSSAAACPSRGESSLLGLDYQTIEYIGPVDETLLCPVCKTPFHSPITTPCGHTFCAGCINRALEMQSSCPIDRQPINKTRDYRRLPLIIKDQLDRLRVRCPNKGCNHECSREHLERHVERHCQFTLVRCPDPNCTKRVVRCNAEPEKGCMHQEIICQYCDQTVTVAELDLHHDNSCNGATVECPDCGGTVLRHRLDRHRSQDCLEGETQCRWSAAGCRVTGKRSSVQEHERSGCMFEAIAQLKEQREEDSRLIASLAGRLRALEDRNRRRDQRQRDRLRSIQREHSPEDLGDAIGLPASLPSAIGDATNTPSSSPVAVAPLFPPVPPAVVPPDSSTAAPASQNHQQHHHTTNNTLPSPSPTWASPEDYMLAQFERMEAHMEDLRKQVLDFDAHQSLSMMQLASRINDQLADLTSKVGVLNMHTTWLLNMQRSQNMSSGRDGSSGSGSAGQQQQQQRGQNQGQGQRAGRGGGGGGGGGGSGGGVGVDTAGGSAGGIIDRAESVVLDGLARLQAQRRRNSDGRSGGNPPRL